MSDQKHGNNDNQPDSHEGHVYDGIVENDNPLPGWWTWSFLIAIIFAFHYFIHYQIAGGPTLTDELNIAMKELEDRKAHAPQILETEESLLAEIKKPGAVELGAAQYAGKCAACHGEHLQGLIGPNLTDSFWIHGNGSTVDVIKVVREGVPAKGMPPWHGILKKDEMYGVVAFIRSKYGSQPAGAKEPQGIEVKPESKQ